MHGFTNPPIDTGNQNKKHFIVLGIVMLSTVVLGAAAMFVDSKPTRQTPKETKAVAGQKTQSKAETKKVVDVVAKKTVLPTDEEPILADVKDREKLQHQEFFQKAQNGDRVLMYPKNKKVFLYRPSTDQVIAVAPLDYKENEESIPSLSPLPSEATPSSSE